MKNCQRSVNPAEIPFVNLLLNFPLSLFIDSIFTDEIFLRSFEVSFIFVFLVHEHQTHSLSAHLY